MAFIDPMLLHSIKDRKIPPKNWLCEIKRDGERALIEKRGSEVCIWNRKGVVVTERFPDVVEAVLKSIAIDCVLDGELLAASELLYQIESFSRLTERSRLQDPAKIALVTKEIPVFFCAFDLLTVAGNSVMGLPLAGRKRLLEKIVEPFQVNVMAMLNKVEETEPQRIFYSWNISPFSTEKLLESLDTNYNVEGVVFKDPASKYVPGTRSHEWLKYKFTKSDTYWVVGVTPGEGRRAGMVGAMLLAQGCENPDCCPGISYYGKVGTGFSDEFLSQTLPSLLVTRSDPPEIINKEQIKEKSVIWIEPRTLTVEIEYQEMTKDGILRFPAFKGVRTDG